MRKSLPWLWRISVMKKKGRKKRCNKKTSQNTCRWIIRWIWEQLCAIRMSVKKTSFTKNCSEKWVNRNESDTLLICGRRHRYGTIKKYAREHSHIRMTTKASKNMAITLICFALFRKKKDDRCTGRRSSHKTSCTQICDQEQLVEGSRRPELLRRA